MGGCGVMIRSLKTVGMLGIGGMGMAPLALYLQQAGYRVVGWDDACRQEVAALLSAQGLEINCPVQEVTEVEVIVYSSAVAPAHPVLQWARQQGVPLMRRGEALAELAREARLIAVVGSHGKTTTAAMLVWAALGQQVDFDYVLGGLFAGDTLPARCQNKANPWLIAEVDESDGTIESFNPWLTVCLNLDWDHHSQYDGPDKLLNAFAGLIARSRWGALLPEKWEPGFSELLNQRLSQQGSGLQWRTFGTEQADYRLAAYSAQPHGLKLTWAAGESQDAYPLQARGRFNALNATAALAVLEMLKWPRGTHCLADFPGVRRRQTILWDSKQCQITEDYAHHPTEIRALLEYYREAFADSHLTVVFQPHRYSRTRALAPAFADALQAADSVWLLPVYAASEAPAPEGRSERIFEFAQEKVGTAETGWHLVATQADFISGLDAANWAAGSHCLLFIGAGDIELWARSWLKAHRDALFSRLLAKEVILQGVLREQEPLAGKTTMGVGGSARWYVKPADLGELRAVLRMAKQHGVPVFILGRGSNLIVADEGYAGLVIRLRGGAWSAIEDLGQGRLRVGAGLRLKQLCSEAARLGMVGFEFLEGIPGSVGGALRMNAGAMGGWMLDVVESVELLTLAGELRTFSRAELSSGYRCCPQCVDAVVVAATLKSQGSAAEAEIRSQVLAYAEKRKAAQPREASAGCIFKNPDGDFAGRLIDAHGLKGLACGGAEVSQVHGNFIINRESARAGDVLQLTRMVRERIHQVQGVWLEPEVLLLGKTWEEVLS